MGAGLFDLSTLIFVYRIHGGEPRFGDDISELDQLILRPAVGYKLNDHFPLWQGYAWVGNYQPSFREENRVYQQLLYRRKFPFVKVLSRTRLEERFIDNSDGTAVRARTMLRGDFPLPDAPEWAIVVYDEIFVNVNAVGNGPTQNSIKTDCFSV